MHICRSCGYPVMDDKGVYLWSVSSCPVCGIKTVHVENVNWNWAEFFGWVEDNTLVVVDERKL